ncbi:MAG: class I SAM-dependent methyltransferase [Candidatus Poseidoniales archaeon]
MMLVSFYKKNLIKFLDKIEIGSITVNDDFSKTFGNGEPKATIEVVSPRFYRRTLLGGDLGFAESYAKSEWFTDNLTNLITILILNKEKLSGLDVGWSFMAKIFARIGHWRRRNTLSGSKKNIQEHYDLSNEMFMTFLDETMTYSCGFFENKNDSLYQAQINKIDKILDKVNLQAGDHLLEIGSGWGALAKRAVDRTGCKVTTITLSERQYTYVKKLIKEENLEDNINIELMDFRKMDGAYDKIVSVEMIEAIGFDLFNPYFAKIEKLMKPGGRAVIQAITYPDENYDIYRKGCDFIQKFIFPGSLLPSVAAMKKSVNLTGMEVEDLERIGPHYATTLNLWNKNFNENIEDIKKLGFDQYFINLWNYYFSYCEAGFANNTIDDVQIVLKGGKASA